MIVCSTQLRAMADALKRRKSGMWLNGANVYVTPGQLEAAARLLRDAEPSVCNGDVQERPGFIERDAQDDPKALVFQVGILPSTTYRIYARGRVERAA